MGDVIVSKGQLETVISATRTSVGLSAPHVEPCTAHAWPTPGGSASPCRHAYTLLSGCSHPATIMSSSDGASMHCACRAHVAEPMSAGSMTHQQHLRGVECQLIGWAKHLLHVPVKGLKHCGMGGCDVCAASISCVRPWQQCRRHRIACRTPDTPSPSPLPGARRSRGAMLSSAGVRSMLYARELMPL